MPDRTATELIDDELHGACEAMVAALRKALAAGIDVQVEVKHDGGLQSVEVADDFSIITAYSPRRPAALMFGSPREAALFIARDLPGIARTYLENREEYLNWRSGEVVKRREDWRAKQYDEAMRVLNEHHGCPFNG